MSGKQYRIGAVGETWLMALATLLAQKGDENIHEPESLEDAIVLLEGQGFVVSEDIEPTVPEFKGRLNILQNGVLMYTAALCVPSSGMVHRQEVNGIGGQMLTITVTNETEVFR